MGNGQADLQLYIICVYREAGGLNDAVVNWLSHDYLGTLSAYNAKVFNSR